MVYILIPIPVIQRNKITQGQKKKRAKIEGSKGQVKGLSP
jgi:hypothetical protein